MKKDTLNLTAAAVALGKTTRQVRRYISAGRLRAAGGGHGVPFMLDPHDLENFKQRMANKNASFRRRVAWPGVVNATDVSRMAYALKLRQSDPGSGFLPWWESTMLWKWGECGQHPVAKNEQQRRVWREQLRRGLRRVAPPLADVPGSHRNMIESMTVNLSPLEIDYIAAMIVCAAHPWKARSTLDKLGAFDFFQRMAMVPLSDKKLQLMEQAFYDGDFEQFRNLYAQIVPLPVSDDLDSDQHGLNSWREILRKNRQDRREAKQGGVPTGGRVATLLGIHREQGARVVKRIKNKLDKAEVVDFFGLLGFTVPRLWKTHKPAIRRRCVAKLACPGCGDPVCETSATCPGCGRLL